MNWTTGQEPANVWQSPVAETPINDDQLYASWYAAQQQLEKIKAEELRLRNEILKRKCVGKPDGTHYIDLPHGWKIKAVVKTNYTLDKDDAKVELAIAELSKVNNEGAFIADRLINWKPELSVKEYKLLGDVYRAVVDKVITTKPGQGSLEIVAPKE